MAIDVRTALVRYQLRGDNQCGAIVLNNYGIIKVAFTILIICNLDVRTVIIRAHSEVTALTSAHLPSIK